MPDALAFISCLISSLQQSSKTDMCLYFLDEDTEAEKENLLKVIQLIHGRFKFEPKYYSKVCSLSSISCCFPICSTFYFKKY